MPPHPRVQLHSILLFAKTVIELDELGDIARHAPDTQQLPLPDHAAKTRYVGELPGIVRQGKLQTVYRVALMRGLSDMLEINRGPWHVGAPQTRRGAVHRFSL
jgi:hypothetical protein